MLVYVVKGCCSFENKPGAGFSIMGVYKNLLDARQKLQKLASDILHYGNFKDVTADFDFDKSTLDKRRFRQENPHGDIDIVTYEVSECVFLNNN